MNVYGTSKHLHSFFPHSNRRRSTIIKTAIAKAIGGGQETPRRIKEVDVHTLRGGYITFTTATGSEYLLAKEGNDTFISSNKMERKKIVFMGSFTARPGTNNNPDEVKVGWLKEHRPLLFITDDGTVGKTSNVVFISHVERQEPGQAPFRTILAMGPEGPDH